MSPHSPSSSDSNATLQPSARDAGFWLRAAAASADGALAIGLSLVLASTVGMFFARRAVTTLRIGEPDTWWQGPIPLMLGVVGEVVFLLPFALWLIWLVEPLTGATLGKRLFRLRVSRADGHSPAPTARWRRSVLQTVGLWGWTLALLLGSWEVAVVATVAGAGILAGSLLALGPRSLALLDRAAGTRVSRC